MIVNGGAGTGKSHVLKAVREAYENDGFEVHGAILQGKTAADLERDSGIKSQTMHSFLDALDHGDISLHKKSVVVVDEAGMVGSHQLQRLLSHVAARGAMVRLVGDAYQLAAVDFGGAFKAMSDAVSAANKLGSLTEIKRQESAWMREASGSLSRHEIGVAVDAYNKRGHIFATDDRDLARKALVDRFDADRRADPALTRIALAYTNVEVDKLNAMLRAKREAHGELGRETSVRTEKGRLALSENDKIVFLKNEYDTMNVRNGHLATVEQIEGKVVSARLDDGRLVKVDLQTYGHIALGYASTIHKSQGMTVDKAYMLALRSQTAELTYVGMTRHRKSLEVHYSKQDFRSLADLVTSASKSEGKAFTPTESEVWAPVDDPRYRTAMGLREQFVTARQEDNVVSHMLRDVYAARAQAKAETLTEWSEIKQRLDGARLLAYVSKSHGVMVDKYEVTKGRDGADRIRVDTKHLTVSDFLTKKMGLTWPDAKEILSKCYAEQQEQIEVAPRVSLKQDLWREFNDWRMSDFNTEKEIAWQVYKADNKARLADIKTEYTQQKAIIERQSDPRKYAERRVATSVLRMQKLEKEKAARAIAQAKLATLKDRYGRKPADLYRAWLAERAEKGDSVALAELRRQQDRTVAPAAGTDIITGKQNIKPVEVEPIKKERISYVVSDRGDVTYRRDGADIIRDEARRVVILRHTKEDIETALRFSVQKFGSHLKLNGTDDFKRRAVEVAVESGLKIEFINPELEQYRQHLVTQKVTTTPTYKEQEQMKSPAPSSTSTSAADRLKQWEQTEAANVARRQQEAEERARRQAPATQHKPKGPDHDLN